MPLIPSAAKTIRRAEETFSTCLKSGLITYISSGELKSQRFRVHLCYVPDTPLSTSCRRAAKTFNARLTQAYATLLKQYLIKSERAFCVHWRALNVHQTSMFNAPGTRMELIRNVYVRLPNAKLLENFRCVFMFYPKRARNTHRFLATYSAAHRTYTKGTQRTRIAF